MVTKRRKKLICRLAKVSLRMGSSFMLPRDVSYIYVKNTIDGFLPMVLEHGAHHGREFIVPTHTKKSIFHLNY